ncbi:Mth938-like domain-containing protein, partial [Thermodesulfobacteriota bacterium]
TNFIQFSIVKGGKKRKRKIKQRKKIKKIKRGKRGKRGKKTRKSDRMSIRPRIDAAAFGSITIEGREIRNDVILRLDGSVEKRKKKLSKNVYGTSHTISLEEAEYVYEEGAGLLIFGTGHYGCAGLSDEAERYFKKHGCRVKAKATPEAIHIWNTTGEKAIGLFHITC